MEEKICVAVRVRPSCEKSEDELRWKVENNSISLYDGVHNSPIPGMSFAFDHVFDEDINNATVYDLLVKNIIQAAAEGFNGAIVAYGQTGSGKTFTMEGIIPRAVEDLFHDIQQMNAMFKFQIRVSCMQIYNEDIIDLLAEDNNQNLETADSFLRGPNVRGLKEEIVNSVNQVLGLFQEASGRSVDLAHTLFVMIIKSKPKRTYSISGSTSDDDDRLSVLNLVDLAGSERASERAAETHAGEEREHTDKSLMVLSDVINKLSEGGKQRVHIPYRDSKLTHILQRALGGNAKTSIICTIAPEQAHIEETKGTLQFASRAKNITNCLKVNETGLKEKQLEKAFQKLEELEENANEEEEDESNEESDEERDEGSDEERDEDYEDVCASDAEEDAKEYHPGEIYYDKYDVSIPWEHYMNTVLLTPVDGLYLKAGAIFRGDGIHLTSSPAFPAVNLEEMDNLFMVFESGVHHDLQLGGKTYTMVRVEPDTMHGEKGGECVTIMKTALTLIFGVYEKPMIRAQCDALVRATANTIRNQGC